MAEKANITPIGSIEAFDAADTRPDMVRVEHVSMVFNMASEQLNNLKEYAIALARRELMFKEFRALDDVSLEVKKGDVFGIMGTNGSGKSTLLKIIAGVLEPTEGTVQINGNIAPLIELGAGFDMDLTARENIYLNGALLGYPKRFIAQHFDEIVEFAEIEQFLDMPLKNYSSGMVARIAFAIATVIVPDILIVDEVLSVGDFMFQQKCERRIQNLIKEHDVTVLIVSHNNDQIERLCNKAIWIEKGHTRMIGSAKEVCQVYGLVGGHSGSSDAECRVLDMLADPTPVDESLIKTIAGEDRYGTAVKLFELLADDFDNNSLFIAPGENGAACMVANSAASALNTTVLLTRSEVIPDTVKYALKGHRFDTLYIIGSETLVSADVATELAEITHAELIRIDYADTTQLSIHTCQTASIRRGQDDKTAVLAYEGFIEDMLSFLPYVCACKYPLFLNDIYGKINQAVIDAITTRGFDRLFLLGGYKAFPEEYLTPFTEADIEIIRFTGKDPSAGNRIINDHITQSEAFPLEEAICFSLQDLASAFVIGPYAAFHHAAMLLVDAQNLDSMSNVIDFITEHGQKIKKLTFLCDSTALSKHDKRLIAKALSKQMTA